MTISSEQNLVLPEVASKAHPIPTGKYWADDLSWKALVSLPVIKTSNYTAIAGEDLLIDTTLSAVTITLPASPSLNTKVSFFDYAGTWDSNNLTIIRNGEKIMRAASDLVITTKDLSFTLVYIDTTVGWIIR